MGTPLILLIILLSIVICALAAYWFYRTAVERKRDTWPSPDAPQIARQSARNQAWDHAVRSARNRNR